VRVPVAGQVAARHPDGGVGEPLELGLIPGQRPATR
jgi:hypothetical protein